MNYQAHSQNEMSQNQNDELSDIMSNLQTETKVTKRKFLKSREVCKLLQCSAGTLYNLRIKGLLSAVKIGGTYYYTANEIDIFID